MQDLAVKFCIYYILSTRNDNIYVKYGIFDSGSTCLDKNFMLTDSSITSLHKRLMVIGLFL